MRWSQNPHFSLCHHQVQSRLPTISDTGEIEAPVDQVLSENPTVIADYKAGKNKAFAFLVGQIMKASRGKASPAIVNELLLKKLK